MVSPTLAKHALYTELQPQHRLHFPPLLSIGLCSSQMAYTPFLGLSPLRASPLLTATSIDSLASNEWLLQDVHM